MLIFSFIPSLLHLSERKSKPTFLWTSTATIRKITRSPRPAKLIPSSLFLGLTAQCLLLPDTSHVQSHSSDSLYFSSHLFFPSSYTPIHARWNGCPARPSSNLNKICIWQVLLNNNQFFCLYRTKQKTNFKCFSFPYIIFLNNFGR